MRTLITLIQLLVADRQRLMIENLALRHQLAVLKRTVSRPRIQDSARMVSPRKGVPARQAVSWKQWPALPRWGAEPAMQASLARSKLRFRDIFAASRAGPPFVLAGGTLAAYHRGEVEERCGASPTVGPSPR